MLDVDLTVRRTINYLLFYSPDQLLLLYLDLPSANLHYRNPSNGLTDTRAVSSSDIAHRSWRVVSTWLLYGAAAGKCYLHLHVTSLFDVIYTHSCTPLKQQLHSAHSGGLRA